ncbi:hypothetical protein [Paenibacillus larvae]|uniref:hypothetical protein n=1 Tax=Paenibacillus larvae TaxID=1464 RepID=UPI00288DB65E|nr:hypothetical protein [Paenibacillus larvae]MDT2193405.1 hypothetical protein [Paenibacillus larvae]
MREKRNERYERKVEENEKIDREDGQGRDCGRIAAMVGGFVAVVKQAADFEQQMSKVKAISGATG